MPSAADFLDGPVTPVKSAASFLDAPASAGAFLDASSVGTPTRAVLGTTFEGATGAEDQTTVEGPVIQPPSTFGNLAAMTQPVVNIPTVTASDLSANPGLGSKIVAGVNQGAAHLAEGLISPLGLVTMGAGSAVPALRPLLGAAFGAQSAAGVPEQARELGTAVGSGNTEGTVASGIGLAGNIAIAAAGAGGVARAALSKAGAPLTGEALQSTIEAAPKPETPAVVNQQTGGTEFPAIKPESPAATPTPESPAAPAPQESAGLWSAFGSKLESVHNSVSDFLGRFAGETLPTTTRLDRVSGEKGARYLSSRIAAKPMAEDFVRDVTADTGIDPVKFGAALSEDNLRSIRQKFIESGDERAAEVKTLVGEDRPFKTEKDYQDYLNSPQVVSAIDRFKALWDEKIDPMYRQAMSIDPDVELPSRGLQTGARVNLLPEDIAIKNEGGTVSAPQGGQSNTLKRLSPFGREATGSSEGYRTNFGDMMNNTIGRQLEIANKNAFDKSLVDSGNAVIAKPGESVDIGGRAAVPFDYARRNMVVKNEAGETMTIPQNRKIYVNAAIEKEYRRASNLDAPITLEDFQPVANAITKLQLAGLTDATVHVSNLATQLLTRPGIISNTLAESSLALLGRADVPFVAAKAIIKALSDNKKQIAELSEIGAMRDQPELSIKKPLSSSVHFADTVTRLVMDDAYKRLVREGVVTDTETNRREFVNQVGQYNKRAQTGLTAMLRDTQLAPFITAGKTFNSLAIRNATLSPGVEAAGIPQAAALRLQIAAKWAGSLALIGAVNYALTGKVGGRAGTPLGRIDTGTDDDAGRPLSIPALDILGFGRALRITGVRGAVDAKRLGLPNQTALDSAVRDIANTTAAPVTGPMMRSAWSGLTGNDIAVDIGRKYPVVPPSDSQHLSDFRHALLDINPISGSLQAASEPGATAATVLQRQLPRYIPTPGKPAAMVDKYADIVRMAKTGTFTDDMIGRVRKMSQDDRNQVVTDSYYAIDPKDREHFLRTLKQRKIVFNFVSPTNAK